MQYLKVIVKVHYAFSQPLSSFSTLLTLIQRPWGLKSLFIDVRSGYQEVFCIIVNISYLLFYLCVYVYIYENNYSVSYWEWSLLVHILLL